MRLVHTLWCFFTNLKLPRVVAGELMKQGVFARVCRVPALTALSALLLCCAFFGTGGCAARGTDDAVQVKASGSWETTVGTVKKF